MAIRINKEISSNPDFSLTSLGLIRELRKSAPKKNKAIEYIGLQRSNALSDLDDPREALNNVLDYITRIQDAGEVSRYGNYRIEDFEITRDFVSNRITTSFLTPLKNASSQGSLTGLVDPTAPRIRLEDRISLIDSFASRGSLDNLHAGPTAIYYKTNSEDLENAFEIASTTYNQNSGKFGDVVISVFNSSGDVDEVIFNTGSIFCDITEITKLHVESLRINQFFSGKGSLIFQTGADDKDIGINYILTGYKVPNETIETSVFSLGIRVKLKLIQSTIGVETTDWTYELKIADPQSLQKFNSIRSFLGGSFNTTKFVVKREFSVLNPPKWFTTSVVSNFISTNFETNINSYIPNQIPGTADDVNPDTTSAVLKYEDGRYQLYTEKESFFADSATPERIPIKYRSVYDGDNIVTDSNMRFEEPPSIIKDAIGNWGIRWDGYWRIDGVSDDKKYVFDVFSNIPLAIDVATTKENYTIEGFNGTIEVPQFERVIDTRYVPFGNQFSCRISRGSLNAIDANYLSIKSFSLKNLPKEFIHYREGGNNYRYVPISIKMWVGNIDLSKEDFQIPREPAIFITYRTKESANSNPDNFRFGELNLTLQTQSGGGGTVFKEVTVNGTQYVYANIDANIFGNSVQSLISSTNLSRYRAISLIKTISSTQNGEVVSSQVEETLVNPVVFPSAPLLETIDNQIRVLFPKSVFINGSGNLLTLITPQDNKFKLEISPNLTGYTNPITLWSTNIVSPKDPYLGYQDLVRFGQDKSLTHEPSIYNKAIDEKPEWWKVSTGNRFIYSNDDGITKNPISKNNDPLDGFISNNFKSVLKSNADGIGLYGNGAATPVYSQRKNIIFGEANYPLENKSSNYIGLRLITDLLGSGGIVNANAIPINNATFSYPGITQLQDKAMRSDELGGGDNDKTSAGSKVESNITISSLKKGSNETPRVFYFHENMLHATQANRPNIDKSDYFIYHGFSPVNSDAWNQPINISVVAMADTENMASKQGFVAPLGLSVKRRVWDNTDKVFNDLAIVNNTRYFYILEFSSTLALAEGLNGKYIEYYTEGNLPFQYSYVDTGESISFSDTLKITFENEYVVREVVSSFIEYFSSEPTVKLKLFITVPRSAYRPAVGATIKISHGDITYQYPDPSNPGQNLTGTIQGVTDATGVVLEHGTGANDTRFSIDYTSKIPAGRVLTSGSQGSITSTSFKVQKPVFKSGLSEVPKAEADRVTPFGFDRPEFSSNGICYPPYIVGDSNLSAIAVDDTALYGSNDGNYDVFWGNHEKPDLEDNILNITEKLSFSYSPTDTPQPTNIIASTSVLIDNSSYTHKLQLDFPVFKPDGSPYDEDILEHVGNKEKVKDNYFLFIDAPELS